jgi:drug/metabolite transporter (DMT)-like permease
MQKSLNKCAPDNTSYVIALFCVCLSGFCFGFLGIFGRLATGAGLSVGELLTYRFSLATLVLGGFLVLTDFEKLKIGKSDFVICMGLGFFGYAFFSTLYFIAINGVSVAEASLLLYTFPILVTLGAWMVFAERPTRAQLIALPLASLGLALVIGIADFQASIKTMGAVTAGLGAAVTYAAYILISSRVQKNIHPYTSAFYVMLSASLGLAVFHQPDLHRLMEFTPLVFAILIGIAVICTVLPLILFLKGLQKLGNAETSLLSTVEPLTAALLGYLFLHESLKLSQYVGGGLVIFSLIVTAFRSGASRPMSKDT